MSIPGLTLTTSQFEDWVAVAMTGGSQHHFPISVLSSLLALYFYECLLTFPEEVSEIWPSKWSLTKMVYLSSRYGGMVAFVLEIIGVRLITDSARVSLPLSVSAVIHAQQM